VKIIHVCPKYYPHIGGMETHIHDLISRLKKAGLDIEVYTTEPGIKHVKQEMLDGISITRFPVIAPSETVYFSPSLYTAMRKVKVDIVHAHNYRALPMLFAALTKKQGTRLVVTTHLGFSKLGKWIYYIYDPLLGKKIFLRADKIIVVSPAELEEVPTLKKYCTKIVYIPNGVDFSEVNRIYSVERPARATVNLLCVSRLERKKGVQTAIKTVDFLKTLPVHLSIIGDGPEMSRLKTLVDGLDLGHLVTFKGKMTKENVYNVYSQSDIFLLLSEYEAHSIALTEAMAFGLVPIVTNVGGNPVIVDEETGYLVNYPADAQKIAEIIKQLMSGRELLAAKSQAARDKTYARFSIDCTVNRLLDVYKSII
jgi:glycosyltransferase involved in cell wall biosynthesis